MNQFDVLVDAAIAPCPAPSSTKKVLELSTFGPEPNVRLSLDIFRLRFPENMSDRIEDLLRIAAVVYSADTRILRGTVKDVWSDKWQRRLNIIMPVLDHEFWSCKQHTDALISCLTFLTEDEFTFEFRKLKQRIPTQTLLSFKDSDEPLSRVDTVVLFSGGSDSLAATLQTVSEGHHPVLVSHRSTPPLDKRQRNLVQNLRERIGDWSFPHISMWASRAHSPRRPLESTQRSRSFLFTSLGAAAASILEVDDVRLCDNGVVSINLPQSAQNVGAMLSRSTHPKYITLAEAFFRLVTERESLRITNSLLFKTKSDVLQIIRDSGYPELLQETVSCAHLEGKTTQKPHCGVCTQCIDRRFASVATGLEEHDLPSRYEKDVFVDDLKEGDERTHAENYARFALKLENIPDADGFFREFPQLLDCLPQEGDVELVAADLWSLFDRHQKIVNSVIENKIGENAGRIRQGSLPASCLLGLVSSRKHLKEPKARYARKLCALLCANLPPAFSTEKAKSETHIQDVGQSILGAAKEALARELPLLPFGAVGTKPDFANIDDPTDMLFVEFKFVRERSRLNGIQTEMTSRVLIYGDQGAAVLFVVYDPNRAIKDDGAFIADFERHYRVWVGVSR